MTFAGRRCWVRHRSHPAWRRVNEIQHDRFPALTNARRVAVATARSSRARPPPRPADEGTAPRGRGRERGRRGQSGRGAGRLGESAARPVMAGDCQVKRHGVGSRKKLESSAGCIRFSGANPGRWPNKGMGGPGVASEEGRAPRTRLPDFFCGLESLRGANGVGPWRSVHECPPDRDRELCSAKPRGPFGLPRLRRPAKISGMRPPRFQRNRRRDLKPVRPAGRTLARARSRQMN